jgi:hypothetical protein
VFRRGEGTERVKHPFPTRPSLTPGRSTLNISALVQSTAFHPVLAVRTGARFPVPWSLMQERIEVAANQMQASPARSGTTRLSPKTTPVPTGAYDLANGTAVHVYMSICLLALCIPHAYTYIRYTHTYYDTVYKHRSRLRPYHVTSTRSSSSSHHLTSSLSLFLCATRLAHPSVSWQRPVQFARQLGP